MLSSYLLVNFYAVWQHRIQCPLLDRILILSHSPGSLSPLGPCLVMEGWRGKREYTGTLKYTNNPLQERSVSVLAGMNNAWTLDFNPILGIFWVSVSSVWRFWALIFEVSGSKFLLLNFVPPIRRRVWCRVLLNIWNFKVNLQFGVRTLNLVLRLVFHCLVSICTQWPCCRWSRCVWPCIATSSCSGPAGRAPPSGRPHSMCSSSWSSSLSGMPAAL